jgi:hypothetical protein
MGYHIEITLYMLQNFQAYNRIIWPLVAFRCTSITHKEAVIALGSPPRLLNCDTGKIKAAVWNVYVFQDAVGERSRPASYFQDLMMSCRL